MTEEEKIELHRELFALRLREMQILRELTIANSNDPRDAEFFARSDRIAHGVNKFDYTLSEVECKKCKELTKDSLDESV